MSHRAAYSLSLALMVPGLVLAPLPATAQTPAAGRVSLTTGLAATSQFDDETNLGGGGLFAVGVSKMATTRLRVEGEISLGRHERSGPGAGSLEATGTPVVGTARVAWLFGPPAWNARPFVSAGLMLMHSRGEFRSSPFVPGPDGHPIPGPVTVQTWRVTKPGWETGVGVELRSGGRLTWRPEMRLSATQGNSDYRPGVDVLEIPIVTFRGGLTLIW